jgi:hypothetical protein
VPTLTEDIFEIELQQTQKAYTSVKTKSKSATDSPLSPEDDEKQRYKEIDEHGDRVYDMMMQRYGSSFDETANILEKGDALGKVVFSGWLQHVTSSYCVVQTVTIALCVMLLVIMMMVGSVTLMRSMSALLKQL